MLLQHRFGLVVGNRNHLAGSLLGNLAVAKLAEVRHDRAVGDPPQQGLDVVFQRGDEFVSVRWAKQVHARTSPAPTLPKLLYSSSWRKLSSRASSPDATPLCHSTTFSSAFSRLNRGRQPSAARAFEQSSFRRVASCGCVPVGWSHPSAPHMSSMRSTIHATGFASSSEGPKFQPFAKSSSPFEQLLRDQQIAAEGLHHMLPRPHRIRIADEGPLHR